MIRHAPGIGACAWLLCQPLQLPAAEVDPGLWDRPRSAQRVMAQPAVRQAVHALQRQRYARLVLVHGDSPEAVMQAEELHSWLVALAVESERLHVRADAAVSGIRLEILQ